ncbi:hypothetical protein ABIB56_003687 [Glaciihabitans sp. UYNi722]
MRSATYTVPVDSCVMVPNVPLANLVAWPNIPPRDGEKARGNRFRSRASVVVEVEMCPQFLLGEQATRGSMIARLRVVAECPSLAADGDCPYFRTR